MNLRSELFEFFSESNTYSQELSLLQHRLGGEKMVGPIATIPHNIVLLDCPKQGQHRSFELVHTDTSGGDIAGWQFEEMGGPNKCRSWEDGHPPKKVQPFKILIVND